MVNNQNIDFKTIDGNPVVTFKDIDRAHGRPEGTAKRNFGRNKKYFIEGKDYFGIKKDNMDEIRPDMCLNIDINNRLTYYFTQSGYLMLVKSFTDDLSWKVQRELVDSYFNVKTLSASIPSAEEIAASLRPIIAQEVDSRANITEKKLQEINSRITKIEAAQKQGTTLKRFTVWKNRIGKEIQQLSSLSDYTAGQIYSNIYTRMNDLYDIDLNFIEERYYAEHPNISFVYTIDLVDMDEERQRIFEKLLHDFADTVMTNNICENALATVSGKEMVI